MKRFKDKRTKLIFKGEPVRCFPADIQPRARKKVKMVVEAKSLNDLKPPKVSASLHLKSLNGNRRGQHSIRINDQWRVCFCWTAQDAMEIEVTDYHR